MSDDDGLEEDRDFSQKFDGQTLERDGPMKSEGSAGHPEQCVPCSFFCYSMSGCVKGHSCSYCHLQHVRAGHRRRRQRRTKNPTADKNQSGAPEDNSDPENPKKIVLPREADLKRENADPEMPRKIALGGSDVSGVAWDKLAEEKLEAGTWKCRPGAAAAAAPPPGLLLSSNAAVSADSPKFTSWQGLPVCPVPDARVQSSIEASVPPPGLLLPRTCKANQTKFDRVEPWAHALAHAEVSAALANMPPGLLLPNHASKSSNTSNQSLEDNQRQLLKLITRCSLLVQARAQSA